MCRMDSNEGKRVDKKSPNLQHVQISTETFQLLEAIFNESGVDLRSEFSIQSMNNNRSIIESSSNEVCFYLFIYMLIYIRAQRKMASRNNVITCLICYFQWFSSTDSDQRVYYYEGKSNGFNRSHRFYKIWCIMKSTVPILPGFYLFLT